MVGIVSERDVVRMLHERGAAALSRPVADIMTSQVITCSPDDSVDSLSVLMTTHACGTSGRRERPNGRDRQLGDVVKLRMEELQARGEQLEAYITQG